MTTIHIFSADQEPGEQKPLARKALPQTAFTKGAPREILQLCRTIQIAGKVIELNDQLRSQVLEVNDSYARSTLRVLALARRNLPPRTGSYSVDGVETNLTFLRLVAMHDLPRPEVTQAVKTCLQAGIRMVMVTGDYGLTAESLARRVGNA